MEDLLGFGGTNADRVIDPLKTKVGTAGIGSDRSEMHGTTSNPNGMTLQYWTWF